MSLGTFAGMEVHDICRKSRERFLGVTNVPPVVAVKMIQMRRRTPRRVSARQGMLVFKSFKLSLFLTINI
jgi:hypothetical protein